MPRKKMNPLKNKNGLIYACTMISLMTSIKTLDAGRHIQIWEYSPKIPHSHYSSEFYEGLKKETGISYFQQSYHFPHGLGIAWGWQDENFYGCGGKQLEIGTWDNPGPQKSPLQLEGCQVTVKKDQGFFLSKQSEDQIIEKNFIYSLKSYLLNLKKMSASEQDLADLQNDLEAIETLGDLKDAEGIETIAPSQTLVLGIGHRTAYPIEDGGIIQPNVVEGLTEYIQNNFDELNKCSKYDFELIYTTLSSDILRFTDPSNENIFTLNGLLRSRIRKERYLKIAKCITPEKVFVVKLSKDLYSNLKQLID
jgi:hypothetical protein